jgi:hypothetical protein
LPRGNYIEAYHVTQLVKAQRALPDALTNLSLWFHDSRKALPMVEQEQVSVAELPPGIPSFGELLDKGGLEASLSSGITPRPARQSLDRG